MGPAQPGGEAASGLSFGRSGNRIALAPCAAALRGRGVCQRNCRGPMAAQSEAATPFSRACGRANSKPHTLPNEARAKMDGLALFKQLTPRRHTA